MGSLNFVPSASLPRCPKRGLRGDLSRSSCLRWTIFSSAVSQVRWEASTSCPQPLFHGVPREVFVVISAALRASGGR
ncbi:hypothetical protein YC2023_025368 [Brassica napus]